MCYCSSSFVRSCCLATHITLITFKCSLSLASELMFSCTYRTDNVLMFTKFGAFILFSVTLKDFNSLRLRDIIKLFKFMIPTFRSYQRTYSWKLILARLISNTLIYIPIKKAQHIYNINNTYT